MVEVLEWRPWEPTGPCRAPRTSPRSLPGKRQSLSKLIVWASIIEGPDEYTEELVWGPQVVAPLKVRETGERNVAKWRYGRPCGQQPMDETYGYCAQGKETSRLRRGNDSGSGYRSECQRTWSHSVSINRFFYYFYPDNDARTI